MFISRLRDLFLRLRIKKRLRLPYIPYIKSPFFLTGGKNISIGENFCCNENVVIECINKHGNDFFNSQIIIGNNCFLNRGTHLSSCNKIIIGDNSVVGSYVSIIDNNHGANESIAEMMTHPLDRKLYSKGPIIIGKNVWICDKAVILGGVTIGDGSVIGANAVVTKNIPPYSIVGGAPARIIKSLNND